MRELLDLLFPSRCAGCDVRGDPLCPRCVAFLGAVAHPTRPIPAPPGLPAVSTVATYDGAVRATIVAYKERGVAALRVPLAAALARAVAHVLDRHRVTAAQLVPVPSSRMQRRARGADVVAALAQAAARMLRAEGRQVHAVRALVHARPVDDSAGLGALARQANMAGAMRVQQRIHWSVSLPVVVVDDVVTSGASLAEASRALAASGAVVLGGATVAATRRRHGDPSRSGGI